MAKFVVAVSSFPVALPGGPVITVNAWSPENVFVGGVDGLAYRNEGGEIFANPAAILRQSSRVAERLVSFGLEANAVEELTLRARDTIRAAFHVEEVNGGVLVSLKGHGVRITALTWKQAAADQVTEQGRSLGNAREVLLDAARETVANRMAALEW